MNNNSIVPIGHTSSWSVVVGALFGAITLGALFYAVIQAGTDPRFLCSSFELAAGAFALGAALSSAFIGGGAFAQAGHTVGKYSGYLAAGGGIAVLFGTFFLFSYFKPANCNVDLNSALTARISEAHQSVVLTDELLVLIKQNTTNAQQYARAAESNSSDAATCSSHSTTVLSVLAEQSERLSRASTQLALAKSVLD